MNLNAKQKKFLILFVLSVIITFRLVAPTKAWGVTNSVINEKNGDIAYSYYSPHDTVVVLCDKEGNELFSKSIPTDGGASTYIAFFGENLGVYVSKAFKKYCFNRNGEELDHTEIPYTAIKDQGFFKGWEESFGKKEYSWNGYRYTYQAPIIFRDKAKLTIESAEKSVTVYESP